MLFSVIGSHQKPSKGLFVFMILSLRKYISKYLSREGEAGYSLDQDRRSQQTMLRRHHIHIYVLIWKRWRPLIVINCEWILMIWNQNHLGLMRRVNVWANIFVLNVFFKHHDFRLDIWLHTYGQLSALVVTWTAHTYTAEANRKSKMKGK